MFLNREKDPLAAAGQQDDAPARPRVPGQMGVDIPSVDVDVATLSGGQRQAIAVARAVFTDAKILLLDEPLAAMGAKEAAIILDLVRDLKQRGDVSVIIIAHNYGQALEICDRVNLLQHGEITFDKLSKDTSVQELNDIVVEEYRRALRNATGRRKADRPRYGAPRGVRQDDSHAAHPRVARALPHGRTALTALSLPCAPAGRLHVGLIHPPLTPPGRREARPPGHRHRSGWTGSRARSPAPRCSAPAWPCRWTTPARRAGRSPWRCPWSRQPHRGPSARVTCWSTRAARAVPGGTLPRRSPSASTRRWLPNTTSSGSTRAAWAPACPRCTATRPSSPARGPTTSRRTRPPSRPSSAGPRLTPPAASTASAGCCRI